MTIKLEINWTKKTPDGLFGTMTMTNEAGCSGSEPSQALVYNKPCVTNLQDRILDGEYTAVVDLSPRLQYKCPHIRVPLRDEAAGGDAGLRIHKANTPAQSLGCIFPGESVDGDAIDDSKDAFDSLMELLPQDGSEFTVTIVTQIEIQ